MSYTLRLSETVNVITLLLGYGNTVVDGSKKNLGKENLYFFHKHNRLAYMIMFVHILYSRNKS